MSLTPPNVRNRSAERIFEHLRAKLANRLFTDLTELEDALIQHLQDFWAEPAVLRQLTGYGWWVTGLKSIHSPSP